MSKARAIRVGIIAEDNSDVDAAKIIIHRIAKSDNVGVKKFVGQGCGRIKRKCGAWASILKTKGCHYLILIHDLDRNDLDDLRLKIEEAVSPCPIEPYLICIPIEEMEAWWLADPKAIRTALKLDKIPKVKGNPQHIASPKEHIGVLVRKCSKNKKVYLNTKHNAKIAAYLDFSKAMRCDSFVPFFDFVTEHIASSSPERQV